MHCKENKGYNLDMPLRTGVIYLGVFFLFASIPALVWGLLPMHESSKNLDIPEIGSSSLVWTPDIRSDDEGWITLTIDTNQSQNSSVLVKNGPQYAKYSSKNQAEVNKIAGARLELSGMNISPGDTMVQPLRSGKQVRFYWRISPLRVGGFNGTVWLYAKATSQNGEMRLDQPLSAQTIVLRSGTFLGLTGPQARTCGAVCSLFAAVLVIGGGLKKIILN
jgi:hypothetical protein